MMDVVIQNSRANLYQSWSTSHLTLTYPSGTAVPFPEESGDCSLWMSSSGGGLFDERRDSNRSLGAFVFLVYQPRSAGT